MTNILTSMPAFALIASVMMLWGQIKDLITKGIRIVVVEAQVHAAASEAILYYLREHGKRLPTNIIKYSSRYEYIKRMSTHRLLAFEAVRDLKNQWYWLGGNLIGVSDKRGMDKETSVHYDRAITLRYLRGTIDMEDLICKAIVWYEARDAVDAARESPRFYVARFVGTATSPTESNRTAPEAIKTSQATPEGTEDWKYSRLLNYSLSDIGYAKRDFFHVFNENARRIKDDVTRWLNARKWYEEKGLLFRRGALLWGTPGSGKSSLIRKIGQSLDLPVFSFELATMNDQQFINFWQDVRYRQPCIVVMEDIDTVFDKRKPANANIRLSFECLLNCISGVEPAEGIYLFVTTNKLECLDEALGVPNARGVSTRPGRLDTCFHMGDITIEEKREIVKHFLSEHPDIGAALIESSNGCTAAQFSDMCSQKALELYWEDKK